MKAHATPELWETPSNEFKDEKGGEKKYLLPASYPTYPTLIKDLRLCQRPTESSLTVKGRWHAPTKKRRIIRQIHKAYEPNPRAASRGLTILSISLSLELHQEAQSQPVIHTLKLHRRNCLNSLLGPVMDLQTCGHTLSVLRFCQTLNTHSQLK